MRRSNSSTPARRLRRHSDWIISTGRLAGAAGAPLPERRLASTLIDECYCRRGPPFEGMDSCGVGYLECLETGAQHQRQLIEKDVTRRAKLTAEACVPRLPCRRVRAPVAEPWKWQRDEPGERKHAHERRKICPDRYRKSGRSLSLPQGPLVFLPTVEGDDDPPGRRYWCVIAEALPCVLNEAAIAPQACLDAHRLQGVEECGRFRHGPRPCAFLQCPAHRRDRARGGMGICPIADRWR